MLEIIVASTSSKYDDIWQMVSKEILANDYER